MSFVSQLEGTRKRIDHVIIGDVPPCWQRADNVISIVMFYGFLIWVGVMLLSLAGCTVKQPPHPVPTAPVVAAPPPVAEQAVGEPKPEPAAVVKIEPLPPQDPDILKALEKYEKTKKFVDIQKATVVKYAFDPERRYALTCPEWGVITIKLLPGEVLDRVEAGSSVRWVARDTVVEDRAVISVRRMPDAPMTDAVAITNANIYLFRFKPFGKEKLRMIEFYDPEAELKRQRGEMKAEEERRRKALASRFPKLSFESMRAYAVSGDRVEWWPVRVIGDHAHTLVELPPMIGGIAQPRLTVFEDGIEREPIGRTIPGRGNNGPVIVVDQSFEEARLTGQNGIVEIRRGGTD